MRAETGTMTTSPPQSSASKSAIGKLLLDAVDLGVRLVDLVDGDDDRNFGRARVIDGLDGLRHHAVVGRDNQNHDIGDFGAAGTHAGERFVTRSIDEDDLLAVVIDVISADVLRDAAGFLVGDVGEADGIEQRGLAVIDVAHDRDHGRAAEQILGLFGDLDILHRLFFVRNGRSGSAELARNVGGEFRVESLVDGREDAAIHQLLDDEVGLHVELFGKLLDRDAFGNGDVAIDGRRRGEFAARLQPEVLLFRFALAIAAAAPAVLLVVLRTARGLIGRRRRSAGTDQPSARSGMHRAADHRGAARAEPDAAPDCGPPWARSPGRGGP